MFPLPRGPLNLRPGWCFTPLVGRLRLSGLRARRCIATTQEGVCPALMHIDLTSESRGIWGPVMLSCRKILTMAPST